MKQVHWEMSRRDWFAIIGASLGAFLAILDIQITNASLKEIQGALSVDFSEGGWISTAYLMAEVVVIPLTAYLSTVFGLRNYMLVNGALFLAASTLCGFSWNIESMIFFRVLQGLTGGTLIPMSFQCMLVFMPPERKSIGLAIFGMTATLAPTLGPSLGGFLTDNFGWRWNFFMNLVPGVAILAAMAYGLPKNTADLSKLKNMDFLGAILMTIGLASMTYMLEDGARHDWFQSNAIKVAALAALICLPTFVSVQLTKKNPLLSLALLGQKDFALACLITMISASALYGGIYALSLYLGQIQNYGAATIGQVIMWLGIPQLFIMPLVPLLMRFVDLRLLASIGLALFCFSNYLNSGLDANFAGPEFTTSLIIRAIGQPLFLIPLSAIGMAVVSPTQAGTASSIFNVLRNLGGSIGIALTGTLLLNRQAIHYQQNLEHIGVGDFQTLERLKGLQYYLASQGQEFTNARVQGTDLLVKIAKRESAIQAFGDIFYLMAFVLLICVVLVFFFKRVDASSSMGETH